MGYFRHHTIIVSSWESDDIARAHAKACAIFPVVSPVLQSPVNLCQSFFIPPDGGKEWNDGSNRGDEQREQFVSWLRLQVDEDGSPDFAWVEVQYGDESWETKIVRDSDDAMRKTEG